MPVPRASNARSSVKVTQSRPLYSLYRIIREIKKNPSTSAHAALCVEKVQHSIANAEYDSNCETRRWLSHGSNMLEEHFLTVLLGTVLSMTLSCSGFNSERSGNISATWNVVPPLETVQKVMADHISSPKMEVIGIDKDLQISDTKMSTKIVERTSSADAPREKKFDFTIENIGSDARFPKIKDVDFVKEMTIETVSPLPKNVILIIVESGQDQEDFWKNFKTTNVFSVEGVLQSCNNAQKDKARFSLDNAQIRDKKHNCEHLLRSNIATLLLWTRDVKGMTTGTLSNANFTIPSLFGFEELAGLSREFYETDEKNMKPEVRSDWHVIDLGKPTNHVSSLMAAQNTREDDEAAWNVFDMFSKVRLVLFRSLLESLGRRIASSNNATPSRKSHLLRFNLLDMLEKLRSDENEKGFVLVVSVLASELESPLEFLQHKESQVTLLVVIEACPHDGKPVPFVAQGPSAKLLREATTIWDVPTAIRHIIASGCQDPSCRNRRHDVISPPITPLKIIPRNVAVLRRTSRDTARKSKKRKQFLIVNWFVNLLGKDSNQNQKIRRIDVSNRHDEIVM
ncbi:hypothetical protein K0M31_014640 [Melipona bicolor]|uniref:Uncharacterized protein n=1 Tax=Melipona bicolor TaxID=60889 RepID=A0AA40FGZ7_9HYME|nr:hypothetical protein K0M31_014640 [Melipona bicolor]